MERYCRRREVKNHQAYRLVRLAIRLKDVQNLLNEDISVDSNNHPGILTQTTGGPNLKKKKHQVHQQEGPRGIASVEDSDDQTD